MGTRKTSPLRLTVRRLDDHYRIIELWDARSEVTNNHDGDLTTAIALLADGSDRSEKKLIGEMLASSSLGGNGTC